MLSYINNAINRFLTPTFCLVCRDFIDTKTVNNYSQISKAESIDTIQSMLCSSCVENISFIAPNTLNISSRYSFSVYAVGEYKDPLRSLIMAKHKSCLYVNKVLASLMWQYSGISLKDFDYIVPVPLYWSRYTYRGYNQAEVIAQHLSVFSGKPVISLAKRVKHTRFQAKLNFSERQENVKKVFMLSKKYSKTDMQNARLLLVDDLSTTGATLCSLAKEISKMRPKSLTACVAARVI